jgi:outer membrane protein OmpA-like peptidoglycan-associated protein
MHVRFSICSIFLLFYFGTAGTLWAQADKDLVEIADETYNFGDKIDALDQYKLAVDINPNNLRANLMAGVVYLETINKDQALKYLKQAYTLDSNCRKDILYLIAQAYHYGEQFNEAQDYYKRYKSLLTDNGKRKGDPTLLEQIDLRVQQCDFAKALMLRPRPVEITSLGKAINTYYPEYAPAISLDEQTLIFTSKRSGGITNDKDVTNEYFEDIYISRFVDDNWTKAKNLGVPINTKGHDASIGLSADGKTLFIYKDARLGDIYFSEQLSDTSWSKPAPVAGNINSSASETSLSITKDGNRLYFSSNRQGGVGGFDLYTTTKDKNGKWSTAKNLGKEINTKYDEESPFIAADGKTLYFSSRGHEGMGGYDIYKSTLDEKNQKWSKPENIGYPINTVDDDIYYVLAEDGVTAYYSSVKENGEGEKDIFKIIMDKAAAEEKRKKIERLKRVEVDTSMATARTLDSPEISVQDTTGENILVKGETSKAPEEPVKKAAEAPKELPKVKQPIRIKVGIKDQADQVMLSGTVSLSESVTGSQLRLVRNKSGLYEVELTPSKEGTYVLTAEKTGYAFNSIEIQLPAATDNVQLKEYTITLRPLDVGTTSILRNIYFDFNEATLKQESNVELSKLEKMLRQNPSIRIVINGHTDKIGSRAYNKDLSEKRAKAVVGALIERGIDASRLQSIGYGESRPLVSNDDETDGRELNRRIEFQVLNK